SPSSSLPHTSPPPPCPLSLHDALPISSHPGPMGHARRRRRIVLRCSGRREPGTAVGGLLEVRAGDVVAGAASPEPPWVACRSLVAFPGARRGSGSRGQSPPREPEPLCQ